MNNNNNTNETTRNTHTINHAVQQLNNNPPANNNVFTPIDRNVINLTQVDNTANANNGQNVSNVHGLLNPDSNAEAPVSGMQGLAIQQQNATAEVSNGFEQNQSQPLSSSHVAHNLSSPMSSQGAIASRHASPEAKCVHQIEQWQQAWETENALMVEATSWKDKKQRRQNMDEIQEEIDALKNMYCDIMDIE
ncbi:predicted protein [Lichtheimia corymbifera JMRC:FSU:9682]|uniref:Uncharacterized protein n=1 Tax=Lichtheimia corymbifera JMRC:FSU:9682 TaxID=1263082 RepID=A0A068RQX5_9FUNG|nr:predicted protein [Lichtheimia corymbifera JMRC:FSU:9682]